MVGFDGLLHQPLVDNTSQANNHNAAVSDDMFNEIRAKLGKYEGRPSELVYVCDINTFWILDITTAGGTGSSV